MSSSRTSKEIVKFSYYERANLHYQKAVSYFHKEKYFSAIKKFKRAIKQIEKHIKNTKYYDSVISYEFKDNVAIASTSAISIDVNFDDDRRDLAHYREFLGRAYYKQNRYSFAIKELEFAKALYIALDGMNDEDHRNLMLCHMDSEIIISKQSKYADAIKEGELAIVAYGKIDEKTDIDRRNLAYCRQDLASDYYESDQNNAAIEQLRLAIKELKIINPSTSRDYRHIAILLNSMSIIYFAQDNDKAAIENLEFAIEELGKIDLDELTNQDLINIFEYNKAISNTYCKIIETNLEEIAQLDKRLQILDFKKSDQTHENQNVEIKQGKSALLANSLLKSKQGRSEKSSDVQFQNRKIKRRVSY